MSYQDRLLGENERVIRRAHRHVLFVLLHTLPLATIGVLLWVLAALNFYYDVFFPGIIAAILLLVSLIPIGIAVHRFLNWRNEEYIVTNFRILQVEGILSKRVLDSSLGRINDVETKQSMFGRMFDYGDVYILTGSSQSINDLLGIDQPFQFKQAMINAKTVFEGVVPDTYQPENSQAAFAGAAQQTNHRRHTPVPTAADMQDTSRLDNTTRIIAALTDLRNAGVLSEEEYQEKLGKLMSG